MEIKFLKKTIVLCFILISYINVFSYSEIITSIRLEGNEVYGDEQIMLFLKSKIGNKFDPETLQSDINTIYRLGFFADVGADTEYESGGVKLIFRMIENEKVKNISFSGNTVFSDKLLRRMMKTSEGKVFNFNTMKQDISDIEGYYAGRGYVLARVHDISVEGNGAHISLSITEPRIDKITVQGNLSTEKEFILKKMELSPGDYYNINSVQSGLEKLKRLDIFRNTSFYVNPGNSAELVDVFIKLEEKKTGELTFGLNYGQYNGFVGSFSLLKKNFRGQGDDLGFELELGEVTNYRFMFYHPYVYQEYDLDIEYYDFSMDKEKLDNSGDRLYDFREKREGIELSLLRYDSIIDRKITFADESVSIKTTASVADDDRQWIRYEQTHKLNNGRFLLEYEITGGFLQGNRDYRKSGLTREFLYHRENRTSGIRIVMRDISRDESLLLEYEKLTVGGSDTLRGYKPRHFSGDRYILLNAEERFRVNDSLWYVVFTDIADINDKIRQTIGFGLAFDSPLGIIRLDYGKPFDDREYKDGRIYMGVGFLF